MSVIYYQSKKSSIIVNTDGEIKMVIHAPLLNYYTINERFFIHYLNGKYYIYDTKDGNILLYQCITDDNFEQGDKELISFSHDENGYLDIFEDGDLKYSLKLIDTKFTLVDKRESHYNKKIFLMNYEEIDLKLNTLLLEIGLLLDLLPIICEYLHCNIKNVYDD